MFDFNKEENYTLKYHNLTFILSLIKNILVGKFLN